MKARKSGIEQQKDQIAAADRRQRAGEHIALIVGAVKAEPDDCV